MHFRSSGVKRLRIETEIDTEMEIGIDTDAQCLAAN